MSRKRNGQIFDYYFLRLPERLRKSLDIRKGEEIYFDIDESKHDPNGAYTVVRIWRDNENEELRGE